MFRSWRLGKAFGIDLFVHWTFLLLLGYVMFVNWEMSGVRMMLYAGVLLVALFSCVVLHELGHALMARRFGIPTRDITLYPLGGVARLERMSEHPWEEFWIAVAGPAVNLALVLLIAPVWLWTLGIPDEERPWILTIPLLRDLGVGNLALLLFNLVPAFPMDGGRVLRAMLVPSFGRLRATEIAASVGTAFAILFVGVGFALGHWGLLLIAGFVYLVGQQELAMVRFRALNRDAEPLDALPAYDEILDAIPADRDPHFSGVLWDSQARVWVLWNNGRPIHRYSMDEPQRN